MRTLALLLALLTLLPAQAAGESLELSDRVVLLAAAVALTEEGLVGTTATITVTAAHGGAGHIFLDTFPLAEVDMQGSARLAVRVASQLSGVPWQDRDVFFVIRSGGPMIGGPSAGAAMTVGAIAALNGWKVRDDVLLTGTVNPDGSVGPVGGVAEKAEAAAAAGVTTLLFPAGQPTVAYKDGFVNVTQHCAGLRIACTPVFDVVEAVGIMTDHTLERPPVPANVTDESYRRILQPLSQPLLDHAAGLLAEAQTALDGVNASGRPPWTARLELARATFARARAAAENGTYYTAASLSFQTAIEGHAIRDSARLLNATNRAETMAQLLVDANDQVAASRERIEGAPLTHAAHVETVGSAQVRLQEAEQRLEAAQAAAASPRAFEDLLGAVYNASYAVERAMTATWWLDLRDASPPGVPVQAAEIEARATEAVETAREVVAYIDAVLAQAGFASGAQAIILDAQAAQERGFHAAAILHALEAETRAASVLEASSYATLVPEERFEAVEQEAARAIEAARARGVEPLLAQSQFEFGRTLENPIDRLSFLGLARVTANLAGLPDLAEGTQAASTRFQGLPPSRGAPPAWIPAAFAVGLALGAGVGLTALMPKKEAEEDRVWRSRRDEGSEGP